MQYSLINYKFSSFINLDILPLRETIYSSLYKFDILPSVEFKTLAKESILGYRWNQYKKIQKLKSSIIRPTLSFCFSRKTAWKICHLQIQHSPTLFLLHWFNSTFTIPIFMVRILFKLSVLYLLYRSQSTTNILAPLPLIEMTSSNQ